VLFVSLASHARHQASEEEAAALSDLGQRLLASRGLSNAKENKRVARCQLPHQFNTQKHAQAAAWRWFFPSGRKAQTGRKLFTFGFAWDVEMNLRRQMIPLRRNRAIPSSFKCFCPTY
jgi:hypothetical protein